MSKEMLHSLIDILPEDDTETIFKVLIKFIPTDDATEDEVRAIINANRDILNNGVVSHDDINWG